jgi:hypothetical protein
MAELAESIWTGFEDGYEWLVATCSLGDLLSICPKIVMGKFVAITAFDSSPLVPTEEERANGWHDQSGIAYSPRVADLKALPYDNCYDEWYIFEEHTEIGRIAEQSSSIFEGLNNNDTVYQFVNYHLGLHLEEQEPLSDLFWIQIRRLRPEVYVADCQSYVTVVSNNKELFASIRNSITGSLSS